MVTYEIIVVMVSASPAESWARDEPRPIKTRRRRKYRTCMSQLARASIVPNDPASTRRHNSIWKIFSFDPQLSKVEELPEEPESVVQLASSNCSNWLAHRISMLQLLESNLPTSFIASGIAFIALTGPPYSLLAWSASKATLEQQ